VYEKSNAKSPSSAITIYPLVFMNNPFISATASFGTAVLTSLTIEPMIELLNMSTNKSAISAKMLPDKVIFIFEGSIYKLKF